MSFRRRALFLAGLFVAVSCSDAGNPMDPRRPEAPETGPALGSAMQTLSCEVDVQADTFECTPVDPSTGAALGAIIGQNVSPAYIKLTKSNNFFNGTDHSYDITIQNLLTRQVLGTVDGTTPHPAGMRVFFADPNPAIPSPRVTQKIVPADSAWVSLVTPDTAAFEGSLHVQRPYFQYDPDVLLPGETSAPENWHFQLHNAAKYTITVQVYTEVLYPKGWLAIAPTAPVLEVGTQATLTAQSRNIMDRLQVEPNVIWSSSNPAFVTVSELSPSDTLAQITGVAEGSAWIKAVSSTEPTRRLDSVLVVVNNKPAVQLDSIDAPARVQVRISSARLRNGLADGDSVVPGQVVNTAKGIATVDAQRGLTYVSKGKFVGTDTVPINVTDGKWTVADTLLVKVAASNYWFVQPGATGDGSNARPLASIASAVDSAETGDTIFALRNGSTDLVGAATLEANQALIGHGVAASFFLRAEALNEPSRVDTIFQGRSLGSPLMNTGAATLTLAAGNTIRGVNVSSANAAAIHGVGFGTLAVGDVIVQADGPALSLLNGALSGSFIGLHSSNSDSTGINLVNVTGSATATAGSISGAATTAVSVSGGSVAISFPGDVTHAGTGRLLQVSSHSGSASFAGTLTATAGTGMLFNAAGGTYAFNGPVSLAGGDAGLDLGSSDGVFTFENASVSTPTGGPAVHVVGGTPALVYRGSITHNTGRAVLVDGITADSVVLRAAITSGTSDAPTGLGILVQNVTGGLVALDSVKSLFTAASPAVTLNNAAGSVRFGHSMDITTTTGAGFTASGAGTVSVTGSNTVATGTGVPVTLTSVNTGTAGVSFSTISTSTGAANGIVLIGISGAGFQGTGGTISGTTGPAVLLTNTNAADSVSLRGMTLSRSGGTGAVIAGTTFGKLHALNTSVTATGGPGALALTTGTMSGTYSVVSSNSSAASGVSLTGVDGTFNASGGSINTANAAAFLVSGGNVGGTISGTVAQGAAFALLSVAGDHSGTITFAGNLAAINGNGLQFTAADGTYNLTGSLTLGGDGSAAGNDAGIDIGSGSSGTVNVTPAGANTANLTSPAGIAIAIAGGSADLTYNGNVTQATNTSLLNVTGGHSGDVAFPAGTVNASNGNGLQFDNADGTYVFGGTITLQGGDAGIDVTNGSGGTITFPTTASIVSPSTGNLISILNSAPSFTYSGGLTKTNNNVTGILISNNTAGTITFNGDATTADGDPADVARTISSGTAAGVNLSSNGTATINFNGGGLNITSTSGAGFTATGGGTVQVTGASNTISSGTGTALNVQNTTIGASGLSFLSISHSGGANGIFLSNTGTTNGLQVTGSGSNGSGGTITNTTGGDGATSGNGIYLSGTRNVSLNWMALSGHQNNGLYGTGVRGLTVNKVRFTGTNGTNNSGAFDESAVNLVDLGGAVKLTNSRFDGGAYNAVRVENISGTAPALDSLVFENDTIASMQGSTADVRSTAMLVSLQDGTADTRIRSNRVTAWWGNAIHVLVQGTATGTTRITNNFVDNTNGALAGAGGIWVAGGNHTYNISGNTVRHTNGTAISADRVNFGTLMSGTIDGNFVGVSGDANSGSFTGIGIFASHHGPATTTVKISNNVLRQINGSANGAITTQTGDALAFGGSGTMNATITGNNIQESGTTVNNAQHGILVTHGMQSGPPTDSDQGCYDVLSNAITNFNSASVAASQNRIRLNQRFSTTTRWPGYTGANTDNAALIAYLLARNTAGNGSVANSSTGGFNNTTPAGSACPQPLL